MKRKSVALTQSPTDILHIEEEGTNRTLCGIDTTKSDDWIWGGYYSAQKDADNFCKRCKDIYETRSGLDVWAYSLPDNAKVATRIHKDGILTDLMPTKRETSSLIAYTALFAFPNGEEIEVEFADDKFTEEELDEYMGDSSSYRWKIVEHTDGKVETSRHQLPW